MPVLTQAHLLICFLPYDFYAIDKFRSDKTYALRTTIGLVEFYLRGNTKGILRKTNNSINTPMIIGIVSSYVTVLAFAQRIGPGGMSMTEPNNEVMVGLANSNLAYFTPFKTAEIEIILRRLIIHAESNNDAGTELFVTNFLNIDEEIYEFHAGPFSHEIVLCGQNKL